MEGRSRRRDRGLLLSTHRLAGLRELARVRGFRRLIAAQVISQAADGLYQIALAAVLIFDVAVADTPAQVTKILAVTLIPFSVIGPFTGPFIDRFSRRSILVGTSLVRAGLTVLLIPAIAWPEAALLSIAVATMSVNRFFHATKSAALPTLVEPRQYLLANSVSSVGGMVFGLAGAVIGGPVADLLSSRVVVVVAAVLMAVAAAVAATLRLPPGEKRGLRGIVSELRQDARDVAQGLRVLARTPRATYAVAAVWTIRGLLGFVLLAGLVLVRARFELEVAGFSALLAAVAVGGFAGALLVPWAARRLQVAGVPPAAFAVAGLAVLLLGPIPLWAAVMAAVFVAGVAMASTKIAADTMVQRSIDDGFRGRAFAVYDIGYNGVFVLAALIPTVLIPALGEIGILVLTGALYLAGAALFGRAARRLPGAIEVRSYAGGRGDEVPREVVWDGVPTRVAEVERSWREDRAGERLLVFRLRLEDGRRIQVSRGASWRLDRHLGDRP